MSHKITLEEIRFLESWATNRDDSAAEAWDVALRAFHTLRDLMSKNLSNKDLLRYLHQQMGITPKSESGRALLSKQSGGSGIPRAILRQP